MFVTLYSGRPTSRLLRDAREDRRRVLVVVELVADDLVLDGQVDEARVGVVHPERRAVLRHLGEVLAGQVDAGHVDLRFVHFGDVEDICSRTGPSCRSRDTTASVWNPPMFVLPRFCSCRQVGTPAQPGVHGHVVRRHGHVGDRIVDAIVEERPAHRHAVGRRHADAGLDTGQPLGSQRLRWPASEPADAELAVQLVQCRRAESLADAAPHADAIARAIQHRPARADGVSDLSGTTRGCSASGARLRSSFSKLCAS